MVRELLFLVERDQFGSVVMALGMLLELLHGEGADEVAAFHAVMALGAGEFLAPAGLGEARTLAKVGAGRIQTHQWEGVDPHAPGYTAGAAPVAQGQGQDALGLARLDDGRELDRGAIQGQGDQVPLLDAQHCRILYG